MAVVLAQGQTILNKYKIIRPIGEGGMARVWLAEEVTFGNRPVALKAALDRIDPAFEINLIDLASASDSLREVIERQGVDL